MELPHRAPHEKTLVTPDDQRSQQGRNSRFFIAVLVIQVSFFIAVFVIATVWQNNLNAEHAARSQTADCQFGYSAELSKVLQVRSEIGERFRLGNQSPAALNAALNQHPYPKVPDCRR